MSIHHRTPAFATLVSAALLLGACAGGPQPETPGPAAREEIVAVTVSNHLLRFNAGQPQKVRDRKPLTGLLPAESIIGIDYRVSRGELLALGLSGQLYKIDVARGVATRIGMPAVLPTEGIEWAFDVNPTVDRVRVANDAGFNLRLHPETGAVVDGDANTAGTQFDGRLAYDSSDTHSRKPPRIVGAAYTYNKTNDKITTNYALDGGLGTLVHQGSKEGVTPVVSPNTGRLYTVGSLGIGSFEHATFDISDLAPTAYAGVRKTEEKATRWHRVDLVTGKATFIGTVGGGEALVGAAIEP